MDDNTQPLFSPDGDAMEMTGGDTEAGNDTILPAATTAQAANAAPTRVPQVLQFTEEEEEENMENLPPPHNLNAEEDSTQPYEHSGEVPNPSQQSQGEYHIESSQLTQTQPTQEMAPLCD